MSPRRVLAEHSSADLSEWQAYDRAFGLGHDDDVRAGVLAAVAWNIRGGLPVGPDGTVTRTATPGDFFARLGDPGEAVQDTLDVVAEPDPADDPVDDATNALKNAWALFALRHNAAVRNLGEPPKDPDAN